MTSCRLCVTRFPGFPVSRVTGSPAGPFEQWAAEHAGLFR